ncbi:hypothetical protein PAECIP111893_01509 [Paenibacillus plantiphilus]|uniref:Knr4/Smi1-like domain-containing protein n=1 Tax=Paenibacillus plantiphilus TaxID=2905650 RepID=A0ABN8GBV4_9BACL|nr:SMI1/KNR4 family protein [Paenibacillus plantiphilus]CAH1200622.1 hypothetical protein PAECIP111893_01509 [Paenibacillus plantiphilus]
MEQSLVLQTLNGLKQRLSGESTLITQDTNGHVNECRFSFNSGVDDKEIEEFEQYTKWKLPDDLLAFLRLHNGGRFFEDEYGTFVHLLKLSEMMQYHTDYMPDHYYTIAIYMGCLLIVDSDAVRRGDKYYLYWFEAGEFYKLNDRFDILFNRWIVAQGEPYWTWSLFKFE